MRDNKILQRIKVAYRFVRYGKGNVRIMTCGKCGSMLVKGISENSIEDTYIRDGVHVDLLWSEYSQCIKCGAVCKEIQMWNFEGNPQKIDKDLIVKRNKTDI